MQLRSRGLCLVALLGAGCPIRHDFESTEFRCERVAECPAGQDCVDGICRGGDDVIDAAPADPLLGPWRETAPLPEPRQYNHQHAATVGGTIYMIGGYDTALLDEVATVFYAHTNPDGTIDGWSETAPLPEPRALSDVIASEDDVLYVIGGADGGVSRSTVYYAPVSPDGTIEEWTATTALPYPRKGHIALVAGGYAYALGGGDENDQRVATTYFARIQEGGLGAWQEGPELPEPRAQAAGVQADGWIYVIGGDADRTTPERTVYRAALDPETGAIGPWSATTSLPEARLRATAVTAAGYLYLIGGGDQAASTAQILHAPIMADGSLGDWELNTSLTSPHQLHATAVAGEFFYVISGSGDAMGVLYAATAGAE